MLQDKQVERLIAKVSRLGEVYSPFLVDSEIFPEVYIRESGTTKPIKCGDRWGGEFCYAEFSFTVPPLDEGKTYYLFAATGGVEHLATVNGQKVGLIDYVENAMEPMFREHKYLPLVGLKAGDKVALESYYSHTIPGTMPYDECGTFALDGLYPDRPYKTVKLVTFYEPLKTFIGELDFLNAHYAATNQKRSAQKVYIELFQTLSLRRERPTESSLTAATDIIQNFRRSLCSPELPYVGIIGHSHLDTAWLWTVDETRKKLHRTISNAVTLLKRYDGYKFFLSSVLYLSWLEEDDPELFAEVSKLIGAGKLEPNGGAWVECDCNLIGGEALVRQFLRGIRYTRQKFGYSADAFWLPDTFGYSAALPQILRQAGIKYFLTTKLSWNDTNVFPYTSFVWRGIDGSEVTVHFNSTHTDITPASVKKRLDTVREDCALMAYGYGDGGGGPSDGMVRAALLTEQGNDVAKVEHTSISAFMDRLSKLDLPRYYGELYLELHRGTYTSGHDLKMYNRRLSEALHDLELISVFAGRRDVKALSDGLYDTLLINTFHDILPGTCIAEATNQALAAQADALSKAKALIKGRGNSYFNTLPFARRELLPDKSGQSYIDALGACVCLAPYDFQPFGYAKKSEIAQPVALDGNTVKTKDLSVSFGDSGITSLIFKGREYCGGDMNRISFAEDVPYIYDNWDIDADYALKKKTAKCRSVKVVTSGEYFAVIRAEYEITPSTLLTTDITVRADSPAVEFFNVLDAGDDHILIKAEFDTTIFSPRYACETQFGYVERNAYPSHVTDYAKFEVCSGKWTDISENGCGLSLLSDVKHGVGCDGKTLSLTLHKSGSHPDGRADKGRHVFRYALYPHEGALSTDTVKRGYAFNYAPVLTQKGLTPPFEFDGGRSVMLETVKFAEDGGIVLRLYECLGGTSTAKITGYKGSLYECNLLEDVIGQANDNITLSPFQIKTLLIK